VEELKNQLQKSKTASLDRPILHLREPTLKMLCVTTRNVCVRRYGHTWQKTQKAVNIF